MAVYLFKLLRESDAFKNLEIGFVVPPTSLRKTMKSVFKGLNNLYSKDVLGPSEVANKKYDILIVDEAHRLKQRKNLSSYKAYDNTCATLGLPNTATQVDWILQQTKCSIFFFDKDQIVFPAGLDVANIIHNNLLATRVISYYTLYNQMRCKGGSNYLNDIFLLLYGKLTHKISDENYEIRLVKDFEVFYRMFKMKEKSSGLTRMIAGYAWEWTSQGDKSGKVIDFTIQGQDLRWNSQLENWVHSDNAVNEVGCIHSVQGYDLNYGFVIVANDIKYDKKNKKIYVDLNEYKDRYGKNNAEEIDVDRYIRNIYYVLLSR